MNKRWCLARRALAALVCLAMVLVWVPGKALAADEIHVLVISNLKSNNPEKYLDTIKNAYEKEIMVYDGKPIRVSTSNQLSQLKTISTDSTQLLIIFTPSTSMKDYAPVLVDYMNKGGCLWLCGENENNYGESNGYIKELFEELSKEMGITYSLGTDSVGYGAPVSGTLDITTSVGKGNKYGEHNEVLLAAANEILCDDPRAIPVITYMGKKYMIDTPIQKGYLTLSADANLIYYDQATPWVTQILYNFLDRSVQKIEEVKTGHTHSWEYTADGSTLYAYCVQAPDAGKQPCAYFVEEADRENDNYKDKAVKISTLTPDMDYTGNVYNKDEQKDENFSQTGVGINNVKNFYYKADENGEPTGESLPGAPSEVGSYVLVATLEVNGKTLKAKSTFKINPVEAPPTVTARDYTGVYDGQPHSITVDAPAGANVTYSTDGINYSAANPAYTNAGTYTVHYDVDGAKGTAAVRIIPRTVSIRWSEETAFRYTGEPQAPAAGAEGLLPSDACEVEVSGAQTEPGEYTAEAVRLSNPNYRLPASGTTQEFRIIRANTSAPSTPSYPIIVRDEAPEGGLVRASRDWSHRGATITVTAEPLEGFRLEQVTAVTRGGKSLRLTEKEGSSCKYTFTMPADKVFVEAVFSREETASTAGPGGEDAPAEPEIHAVSESPAVPEGTALTCPGVTACPIWPYFDANPSAWYHDGVHYCLENGLMTGYDDATLRPRDTVGRAEALVMLWRLRGTPAANSAPAFTDVSETAWYAGAVRWAASENIVLGTGTGRFAPSETLTHRQLNTILQRCAQSMGLEPPALMGEDPATLVSRAQAAVALADFAQNTLK